MKLDLFKKYFLLFLFSSIYFVMVSCTNNSISSKNLSKKALEELNRVLQEQSGFIKVHAAEYLIWLDHKKLAKNIFLKENKLYNTQSPYRIGIWRVLAQAYNKNVDREYWKSKIISVFGDNTAPDRLHACETLAKLHYSPLARYPVLTDEALASSSRNFQLYALWAVSYSSDSAMTHNRRIFLKAVLADPQITDRKIAAYILRNIKGLSLPEWVPLAKYALAQSPDSGMRKILLNTAFVTWRPRFSESLFKEIGAEMVKSISSFSIEEKTDLALSLSEAGDKSNLPQLISMMEESDTGKKDSVRPELADLRAAASYAILRIENRAVKSP